MTKAYLSPVKNPWEFVKDWYKEEEVAKGIANQLTGDGNWHYPMPTDVSSPEFAAWLTEQYRLAMLRGIHLAVDELRAKKSDGPKLPFELGKSKLVAANPRPGEDEFEIFPMRIEDGRLIVCVQGKREGHWDSWNLNGTIESIRSGHYRVESTGRRET